VPIRHFPITRSTPSRRGISRAVVLVLLGLQALLWGGGSIIEARAAAESLSRYSHFEDRDAPTCPPIHSHLDCLICRTFADGALTARPRDLLPIARRVDSTACASVVGFTERDRSGPLGSRAPPMATAPDRSIA
jgi:hypothetical protein